MKLFSEEGLKALDNATDLSIYHRVNKQEAGKAYKFRVVDGLWAWRIFVLPDGETKQRPIRSEERPTSIPENATEGFGGEKPKWVLTLCLMCWDYQTESFKLLEFHQTTILTEIKDLLGDENWGDFREYDISVKRMEKDGKVSYKLTPLPKKPQPKEMVAMLKQTPYRMENLYDGGHPFGPDAEFPEDEEAEEEARELVAA
jgi:hypothetical protein